MNVEYVTMNNIDYIIFDKININGNDYIYLVNENDEFDFYIRKIVIKDNKEYMVNIESKEEFDKTLQAFINKHTKSNED